MSKDKNKKRNKCPQNVELVIMEEGNKNWRGMKKDYTEIEKMDMYGAEQTGVWLSILTGNSRKENIVTIGLTKTHSLALMVCVSDWMRREGADRAQQSQWQNERTEWTERWPKNETKGEREGFEIRKEKEGWIKAFETWKGQCEIPVLFPNKPGCITAVCWTCALVRICDRNRKNSFEKCTVLWKYSWK